MPAYYLILLFTVYQDLLAVVASTERRFFRMKFNDEVSIFQLHDLLVNRLSFDSISTTVYFEDVNIVSFDILLSHVLGKNVD